MIISLIILKITLHILKALIIVLIKFKRLLEEINFSFTDFQLDCILVDLLQKRKRLPIFISAKKQIHRIGDSMNCTFLS